MTATWPIRRALLSTSDKTGLVTFAKQLVSQGISLISTGGTAKYLADHHIPTTLISDYTGFPEILDGRVKTLHPRIYAGILARRDIDMPTLETHQIDTIDLVVVNLYPFQQTVEKPDCSLASAIEQIDVGGPCMLRAAAKNFQAVTVIIDPNDYSKILDEIRQNQTTTLKTRRHLAEKAFTHTANYDLAISRYLTQTDNESLFPESLELHYEKKQDLRYGENPHQKAAFYRKINGTPHGLANATLHQGKPLSFNNLIDGAAALDCVRALDASIPAAVIVKHATPCGAAQADTLISAYELALSADPTSAFGGIIALNQCLDATIAERIVSQQFAEVLIAPKVTADALTILQNKPNLRVLSVDFSASATNDFALQTVSGGLLAQQIDISQLSQEEYRIVSNRKPSADEMKDLRFAWQIVKFVKSNAIVLAKNQMTIGIGSGQTSRVFSTKIAILKATEANFSPQHAVLASDAFFPFADSVKIAADAGISAIIQPGGSIRDPDVIAEANSANIAMVFTGMRHFRH